MTDTEEAIDVEQLVIPAAFVLPAVSTRKTEVLESKLEKYTNLEIEDEETYAVFSEIRNQCLMLIDEIEDQRKQITDPLYQAKKALDADAKVLKDKLQKVADAFAPGIIAWLSKVKEEQGSIPSTMVSVSGTKTKLTESWDYEVTARSRLPARYVEVKKGEIRKAVNAMDEETKKKGGDIPGVKVFPKKGLSR